MPEGMAKALDPEGETTFWSSGREKLARMSGRLLLVAVGGIKHMRKGQAQVHQAGIRDAVVSPLRYRAFSDGEKAGHLYGATHCVNDSIGFCFVHAPSIDDYTCTVQYPLLKKV